MSRYRGHDLWFVVPVLYTLFDQLQEGQLSAEGRRPVLTEWTERFISESNPWNAAEMRVLAYVVVGDEAKARAAARIAKDAQPNTTVGTQMKESPQSVEVCKVGLFFFLFRFRFLYR